MDAISNLIIQKAKASRQENIFTAVKIQSPFLHQYTYGTDIQACKRDCYPIDISIKITIPLHNIVLGNYFQHYFT